MDDPRRDDFYVGYQRRAPAGLARRLRGVVAALLALAVGVALLLAAAQEPFGGGTFEFGTEREWAGTIVARPYPMLLVPRPTPDRRERDAVSRYLLVARGKHGADAVARHHDSRPVDAAGTLIHRGGTTMIELAPGSPARLRPHSEAGPVLSRLGPFGGRGDDLGSHTLRGEIVDSKCFLGVMKPNREKPHRACAELCIRGGIPPALAVARPDGGFELLLLVDAEGEPVGRRLLDRVAEPVEVTGRVRRYGDLKVLAADPEAFRRLEG